MFIWDKLEQGCTLKKHTSYNLIQLYFFENTDVNLWKTNIQNCDTEAEVWQFMLDDFAYGIGKGLSYL